MALNSDSLTDELIWECHGCGALLDNDSTKEGRRARSLHLNGCKAYKALKAQEVERQQAAARDMRLFDFTNALTAGGDFTERQAHSLYRALELL